MTVRKEDTEKKILDAAQTVFYNKGMDGARMQEIANEAGINKSLLHYYYRSKDKLFEMIFRIALAQFVPKITSIWEADIPIFDKIQQFVDKYTGIIKKKPFIPSFVLHELNRHPQRLAKIMQEVVGNNRYRLLELIKQQIDDEVEKGIIKPVAPEQLMVNIIGLCIFPYVAKPILKGLLFENDTAKYNEFLESRRKQVAEFIINAIKVR